MYSNDAVLTSSAKHGAGYNLDSKYKYKFQLNPSKQRNPSAQRNMLQHPSCMLSVPYLRVLHRLSIGKGIVWGKSAQKYQTKVEVGGKQDC